MAPIDADEKLVVGFSAKAGVHQNEVINAAFVDGGIRSFNVPTTAADLRAMTSIAGNDSAGNAP